MREFLILEKSSLRQMMVMVWQLACQVIDGGAIVVTVARESKSRAMERKYHAMINDITRQVSVFGRQYSSEVWKALLVDQYKHELEAIGEPLAHPGQVITSMDGQRAITVRPSTTKFRKHEGAGFIEYLYTQGCEMGVSWSEPALRIYQEYAMQKAA